MRRLLLHAVISLAAGISLSSHANDFCKVEPLAAQLLALHNQARAQPQRCGKRTMPAAPPIEWHCGLSYAAQRHALDMAQQQFVAHRGSDGSSFTSRIENAGFAWQAAAENVGSSYRSAPEAMIAWMASAPHCANIMNAEYQYFGAARVDDYWAVVFAR